MSEKWENGGEVVGVSSGPAMTPGASSLRRKEALESIPAGIIATRGSLEGLLDEFLAERREEARLELGEESDLEIDPVHKPE
jgi:hypothetical protein